MLYCFYIYNLVQHTPIIINNDTTDIGYYLRIDGLRGDVASLGYPVLNLREVGT